MSHTINLSGATQCYASLESDYDRGYEAGLAGKSSESCPYDFDDYSCDEWLNGWRLGNIMYNR